MATQVPCGGGHPTHLDAVLRTAAHHFLRNDAVRDGAAFAVDISQEVVQGDDALLEARLEHPPLGVRQDAGQAVYRDDSFVGLFVAVHGERDALVQERTRHPLLDFTEFHARKPAQGVMERQTVGARGTVGLKQLVVDGVVDLVSAEVHGRTLQNPGGESPAASRATGVQHEGIARVHRDDSRPSVSPATMNGKCRISATRSGGAGRLPIRRSRGSRQRGGWASGATAGKPGAAEKAGGQARRVSRRPREPLHGSA